MYEFRAEALIVPVRPHTEITIHFVKQTREPCHHIDVCD